MQSANFSLSTYNTVIFFCVIRKASENEKNRCDYPLTYYNHTALKCAVYEWKLFKYSALLLRNLQSSNDVGLLSLLIVIINRHACSFWQCSYNQLLVWILLPTTASLPHNFPSSSALFVHAQQVWEHCDSSMQASSRAVFFFFFSHILRTFFMTHTNTHTKSIA